MRSSPISKPIFVYLQRPDDGAWVTVGRYRQNEAGEGLFLYAPSYADAGLIWSIDPVNLPFMPGQEFHAARYSGLHDALRDVCPDAWGQALLRREHNLREDTPPLHYLLKASNADRWGALAIGPSPKPPQALLNTPALPLLSHVVEELAALVEHKPPVRPKVRARLVQTASLGGARPKATVQGENGQFWMVKPAIPSDVANTPLLEHFGQRWGALSGLRFAETAYHSAVSGRSAVQVMRFDRTGMKRHMCISAASLLQAEYPGRLETDLWSYPRLAGELRRIGAPIEDWHELFGRMVFNAMCGNDDDHARNHAAVYSAEDGCWRLSPAFDVVPNPLETPVQLQMQLSTGRFDISREALLGDSHRFGFSTHEEVNDYLSTLLQRITTSFSTAADCLDEATRQMMQERLEHNIKLLIN
ncbi:type II toxin-antitoxin system HipA family toxin [Collimonas humicola]|uniref:type II toxin-antitoxin system HipA family toxin n=1 Tax=Collimonas humicola TaxID=2825886 RepID=UPI001B8D0094|nr:HipA domain-containing protein [Collimonas humicola]